MPNCDNGYSKSLWVDNGWLDKHLVQEELYDLIFDPNETNNLIDSPELTEVASDSRTRLEKWMRETGDPALHGMPGTHCPESVIVDDQNEAEPNSKGVSRLTPEFCRRNEIL